MFADSQRGVTLDKKMNEMQDLFFRESQSACGESVVSTVDILALVSPPLGEKPTKNPLMGC